MSLESAVQQDTRKLEGDLHSLPKTDRRLCNQDVYALEWALPHSGSDRFLVISWIRDIQSLLDSELASSNPALDSYLASHMQSGQFRSRPDFQRAKIAIEQWVPAMDCWMVNGYFDRDATWPSIISTLQAGDPRRRTAEEELADRREKSAAVRKSNEASGTDRVLGAVDAMTDRQVREFVEVEQALHTGETITVRGDDRRKLESLVDATRDAAHSGDPESQRVVLNGQRDSAACQLPSTNPLRHRHRSERHPKKES